MYALQKYHGRRTRHECPKCGKPNCFTLYVNEDGKALHKSVGRCDHQNKCGYCYTPSEFFRDHPSLKVPESWTKPMPEVEHKLWTISNDEVVRFRSNESTLMHFLSNRVAGIADVAAAYKLGALVDGSTIYWQIDAEGRVRTGKVMAYGEDGHRIKNPANDRITWMHSLLKADGRLTKDFELTQCLFGEHLLAGNTGKRVALVESEKTAIIMAAKAPDFVWLATGGKFNLTGDKMNALKGRKVFVYPDADAVEDWTKRIDKLACLFDIRICDLHYSQDDINNKRDIADLIL